MPFVERDDQGRIIGAYENLQPGYADEYVEGDVSIYTAPPAISSYARWLAQLHTRDQRIAWIRAREQARLLAIGSSDLDGESEETLEALQVVGEWFMVAEVNQAVSLADDAIYGAGTTLGVYADPAEITRIKANEAP